MRRAGRSSTARASHGALLLALWLGAAGPGAVAPAAAQPPESGMRVYAHTLKHQQTGEALALIRPLLSPRGTVEEQPGTRTLVIRDSRFVVARIVPLLVDFDHPPEKLRFDIKIVRAGNPPRQGVSPPLPEGKAGAGTPAAASAGAGPPAAAPAEDELSPRQVARLRDLLRYDEYRVLAQAGLTSEEGEEVTYALGDTYSVSFRSGTVLAGKRLKLEGFRITKQIKNPTNKGRQLKPREVFHATLNLWLDRPYNLVLALDESRKEALMVAISCRRENVEP